jgi:hypothetical protein
LFVRHSSLTLYPLCSNEGVTSYTQEFTGFFVPPVTANYSFYTLADDTADVYISSGLSAAPSAMTRICGQTTYAGQQGFFTYSSQISAPRLLYASQKYYMRIRHVQIGGQDSFSLGMRIWTEVGAAG